MRIAIVGATGYGGQELLRILTHHPEVKELILSSTTSAGEDVDTLIPSYRGRKMQFCKASLKELADKADVVFLATPTGYGMKNVTDEILEKTKVIDLSADFRLKNSELYEEWYDLNHTDEELLDKAVYGLSEWNEKAIKEATLLANPGCYVTASLLALLPLTEKNYLQKDIIIDAKSGVSGAGKGLNLGTHYPECNESLKAYKVGSHRHTPEIEQTIHLAGGEGYQIQFTPHLVPMNRGIHATIYGRLTKEAECLSEDQLRSLYMETYEGHPFVRILPAGVYPETKWVKGSNYCDISIQKDPRTGRVILLSTIDNLVKGAAGQAVQNMNIMFGFDQMLGLDYQPLSI